MDYALRFTPAAITVIMLGQFTYSDHQNFREILYLTQKKDIRHLDLNLGGVSHIDSSGIGMLLLLKQAAEQKHIAVRLHSPQERMKKVLEITNFHKLFEIIP